MPNQISEKSPRTCTKYVLERDRDRDEYSRLYGIELYNSSKGEGDHLQKRRVKSGREDQRRP